MQDDMMRKKSEGWQAAPAPQVHGTEESPLVSVCAWCFPGLVNVDGRLVSHGVCARHYRQVVADVARAGSAAARRERSERQLAAGGVAPGCPPARRERLVRVEADCIPCGSLVLKISLADGVERWFVEHREDMGDFWSVMPRTLRPRQLELPGLTLGHETGKDEGDESKRDNGEGHERKQAVGR